MAEKDGRVSQKGCAGGGSTAEGPAAGTQESTSVAPATYEKSTELKNDAEVHLAVCSALWRSRPVSSTGACSPSISLTQVGASLTVIRYIHTLTAWQWDVLKHALRRERAFAWETNVKDERARSTSLLSGSSSGCKVRAFASCPDLGIASVHWCLETACQD